eukprot:scaffold7328_cov314-Pinguiococcus_pyrenoidosus.AAC.50
MRITKKVAHWRAATPGSPQAQASTHGFGRPSVVHGRQLHWEARVSSARGPQRSRCIGAGQGQGGASHVRSRLASPRLVCPSPAAASPHRMRILRTLPRRLEARWRKRLSELENDTTGKSVVKGRRASRNTGQQSAESESVVVPNARKGTAAYTCARDCQSAPR